MRVNLSMSMSTTKYFLPLAIVSLGLSACDKATESPPPAPAPVTTTAPTAMPVKVAKPQEPAVATEMGDFGSDEPLPRTDMPARGVLLFKMSDGKYVNMDHWEEYNWQFKSKRWGHYQVRITYKLTHSTLGVQFKLGETRLRKTIGASGAPRNTILGEVFISEAGPQVFSLYTPATGTTAGFAIEEIALIPSNEGEPVVQQAADGSITLLAKDATTWAENMRYEAKPEKNCLGFWTEPDDFAEWEFQVTKPGRYQVLVSHGCGNGNGGSEVAVRVSEQTVKFKVEDTGGFQNWKEAMVGEIEIKAAGTQRLVIDPETKAKSAVLDVQKVVLKPVS